MSIYYFYYKVRGEFMKWYALFVQSGNELAAQKWLNVILNHNFSSIVPRRRLLEKKLNVSKEVVKTIFPGYIFINTDMSPEIYYYLKKIPHFIKILHYDSFYSEIPQNEIDIILKLTSQSEIIDFSEVSVTNSKITVLSGPLKNNEYIIKKIDKRKQRASINLNIMGEKKKIDIGIKVVSQSL